MNTEGTSMSNGANDVDAAKREVEAAERALSHDLRRASNLGKATVNRAKQAAKPVLIAAAVVVGVIFVVSRVRRARQPPLLRALRRELRDAQRLAAKEQHSALGDAARSAFSALATTAARKLAEGYISTALHQPTPAGRPASPQPEVPHA